MPANEQLKSCTDAIEDLSKIFHCNLQGGSIAVKDQNF